MVLWIGQYSFVLCKKCHIYDVNDLLGIVQSHCQLLVLIDELFPQEMSR